MGIRHESALVCQFLENISSDVMERFPTLLKAYLRDRNGIYALYRKRRLYYVGLASKMSGRLAQHLKDRHAGKWSYFSVYLTIGDSHIKELESLLLRILRPPGNSQSGKFPRAENLKGRLRGDIKKIQKYEEELLFGGFRARALRPSPVRKIRGKGAVALSELAQRVRRLRGTYNGRVVRATLLASGAIRMNKKRYGSLSEAARAAVRGPANGWDFWRFERAPGEWVRVRVLRR
ncbi:MAG: hypothetical protein AMXMBFR47_31650 [Planctomycetota bacterium]